jgi:hypothetical protein
MLNTKAPLSRRQLLARQDAEARDTAAKQYAERLATDPEFARYDASKKRHAADREVFRIQSRMTSRVSQLGIAVKALEELEQRLLYTREREPHRVSTLEEKIAESRFALHELRCAIANDDEKLSAARDARKALGA